MGLIVIEKRGKKKPGKYINNSFAEPINNNQVNQEVLPEEQVVFTVPSDRVHNEQTSVEVPNYDLPKQVSEPVQVENVNPEVVNQEVMEPQVDEEDYKYFVANDSNYKESFETATSDEYVDFKDEGMSDGVIKNEGSLVSISFFTILESYLAFFVSVVVLLVISYLIVRSCGFKYVIFPSRATYSVDTFNHDIKISMLILAICTALAGIVAMICLNIATRRRFKRYYLEPLQVYLYDAFLVIVNLFLYVIICLIIFNQIDNLYVNLQYLSNSGTIEGPVNIDAIMHFKMFIVIIDSVLLALSGYFCVDINHQKNKYVFMESHF